MEYNSKLEFLGDLGTDIDDLLIDKNTFCVTDENVYNAIASDYCIKERTFILPSGEDSKSFDSITAITKFLLSKGANRNSHLVAFGGGVVGDITGFVASTFMRGIAWSNIPTTLLAQVDSAIGGKTGVNIGGIKNIVGAFHFPTTVYFNRNFLRSLPKREVICGGGEIIKTAALSKDILESLIFEDCTVDIKEFLSNKYEHLLIDIVYACANFKHEVVKKDPFETKGLRKILNYGHTVGHAFETADNHRLGHGEYVLHGMRIENQMFKSFIEPKFYKQMKKLIDAALSGAKTEFNIDKSIAAATLDKKNSAGKISIIIMTDAGKHLEQLVTKQEFEALLRNAMQSA